MEFRLSGDSFRSPAIGPVIQPLSGAKRRLQNSLLQTFNPANMSESNRALSASARMKASLRGRETLYETLREGLGAIALATAPGKFAQALAADGPAALRSLATQLGDVRGLLEGATGPRGPYKNDELLRDLKDAIDGLLVEKGGELPASLGDLGLAVSRGDVLVDAKRLEALKAKLPDLAASNWPTVIAEEAGTLFAQGAQALQDKQNQAPFEERLAEQAVHVKAEMTRLQTRQTALLYQQVAFEKQQDTLKTQQDTLKKTQRQLAGEDADEQAMARSESDDLASKRVERLQAERPAAPAPTPAAPQLGGLLSFESAS